MSLDTSGDGRMIAREGGSEPPSPPVAVAGPTANGKRRRPTNPQEQERRRQWGLREGRDNAERWYQRHPELRR